MRATNRPISQTTRTLRHLLLTLHLTEREAANALGLSPRGLANELGVLREMLIRERPDRLYPPTT